MASIIHADGPVPFHTKTFAGTVLTKVLLTSYIHWYCWVPWICSQSPVDTTCFTGQRPVQLLKCLPKSLSCCLRPRRCSQWGWLDAKYSDKHSLDNYEHSWWKALSHSLNAIHKHCTIHLYSMHVVLASALLPEWLNKSHGLVISSVVWHQQTTGTGLGEWIQV